jgi:type 1 glutamine amidotransferase
MKRALILSGGWPGHQPAAFAGILAASLHPRGIACDIETSPDILTDAARLSGYALIVPNWTMGQLTKEQTQGLVSAIRGGTGLAGIHGGMCDAFRGNPEYEWMTGGIFAGHPHTGDYTVRIRDTAHPVTAGLPPAFAYASEQYYMLVEPGLRILAETDYTFDNRTVAMPVAWTKTWGAGRVFYCSLGHAPEEFSKFPDALELITRGFLWAARVL